MALETGTYISDLVSTNPAGTDTLDKADDHLRLIKSTIKATFPNITGAVTLTQAQLNAAARTNVANTFSADQTINNGRLFVSTSTTTAATLETTAASSDNVQLRFKGTSGDRWAIGNNVGSGGTGLNFEIYDLVNSLTRFTISSSGNVGIGAAPGSTARRLTVYGSTAAATTTSLALQNATSGTTASDGFTMELDGTVGYLWNYENDSIRIGTNATERMRIDSSGRVGIGATSPAVKLEVGGTDSTTFFRNSGATTGYAFAEVVNTGCTLRYGTATSGGSFWATGSAGSYSGNIGTATATALGFGTNDTLRMTIDSSGFVGVAQSPDGNARFQVQETNSASRRVADFYLNVASSTATPAARFAKQDNNTTTSNKFIEFTINSGGIGSGQINANGAGAAAFGAFSDIRLKENITDLPGQLDSIMALRPVEFDYKDGSGHQIGFIAQEVQAIYPDSVGQDGEYLTLTGFGRTETRLIKALQEAVAKIDALEARIAALEAA